MRIGSPLSRDGIYTVSSTDSNRPTQPRFSLPHSPANVHPLQGFPPEQSIACRQRLTAISKPSIMARQMIIYAIASSIFATQFNTFFLKITLKSLLQQHTHLIYSSGYHPCYYCAINSREIHPAPSYLLAYRRKG